MRRKANVLIGVGLLLIAAALSLVIYNAWDSDRAAKDSEDIVNALDSDSDVSGDSSDGEMPTKNIDGYDYIGELEVPIASLKLPVMAEWDYTRLRISPCRYTGSYLTNDLVICGHNYPAHFRYMLNIDIGTDIYFDTVDGQRIHYKVSNRETVQPTSIEHMVENDKNSSATDEWDLTIFTCNLGGRTRCAVRCVREDG